MTTKSEKGKTSRWFFFMYQIYGKLRRINPRIARITLKIFSVKQCSYIPQDQHWSRRGQSHLKSTQELTTSGRLMLCVVPPSKNRLTIFPPSFLLPLISPFIFLICNYFLVGGRRIIFINPESSRTLILMMSRAQRRLTLTAGKILDLSLETFTGVRFKWSMQDNFEQQSQK